MCNLKQMNIKSVSPNGIKHAFIPCGECLDCRLSQQFGWIARIRFAYESLLKVHKQVNVCMFTLTYRDSRLPHIPLHLVKDEYREQYKDSRPACFNKLHIRSLVRKIRNWLYDVYYIKQPVYMICSEFGEHTQRPHYHGVFVLPAFVDAKALHKLIHDFWCRHYGFICPNEFEGSAKFHIKPFLAENPVKAISYCAKYCCKDLAYHSLVNRYHFDRKVCKKGSEDPANILRILDFLPFHFQSRSLGRCYLDNLSENDKISALKNGVSFIGESKLHALPKYFKDHILFDNDYRVEDGKRLCRRKPSAFFFDHYLEVYKEKRNHIEDVIKNWRRLSYWMDLGCSDSDYRKIENLFFDFSELSNRDLADCYLAFYGRPLIRCYSNVSFEDQWFSRYFENDIFEDFKPQLCNSRLVSGLEVLFSMCHLIENSLLRPLKDKELQQDRENKYLHEKLMGH